MMPGIEAGLRFEYFEQSDLCSGTGSVDRAALTFPNDNEIQQRTVNRNTWLDLNDVIDPAWAITLSVPYHDGFHTTIAAGDTDISTSRASGLGDLRLLGRYQKFGTTNSFGLQFGLKLPTGRFDQNFADGPQAGGLLDRGLATWHRYHQPDPRSVLVHAPNHGVWAPFVQATLEQPLAARAGFLPSTSVKSQRRQSAG